jgi:tetratricopeptide (TPR) repeat protein
MADDKMLQEAIEAVAKGQRERARDLLTRLLRANQANPKYWLWMSSVVESSKERVFCLGNVLKLEPHNRAAMLGLILEGKRSPPDGFHPRQVMKREWSKSFKDRPQETGPPKYVRRMAYIGATVLVLGLISIGFIAPRLRTYGYFGGSQLTVTPVFNTQAATATLLPTNTPRVFTPTPTFIGPTPLWMFLDATYTPTPIYIDTPHPITEAYRAGIRAFNNGNYEEMLMFMQQAAQAEPRSPDIHFYIGEAYLLLKKPKNAMRAYEKAVELDANFAPAYLGRAKAMATLDAKFNVEADLQLAVRLDPSLASAYLELIAFYINHGEPELALQELTILEGLIPESPLVHLYYSQALLQMGEYSLALEAAQQAYELDQTILPVYLTLGTLYLNTGDSEQASQYLDIYLRYEKENPHAWAFYGRSLFVSGENFEQAVKALDRALRLDENSFISLLYRGLIYLEVGEGQLAVNDLFMARNFDRQSFEASLGLARALHQTERLEDAVSQFTVSEELAETDAQRAAVYYWRARTFNALGEINSAVEDYLSLLDLPPEIVLKAWRKEGEKFILKLTPTPTSTVTQLPPTNTPTEVVPTSTPSPSPNNITDEPTASPAPYER